MKKDLHQTIRITVSIDSVIFGYAKDRLNVLLIKRQQAPFKDKWSIPGGLLKEGSTSENEAKEILKNKAGIKIDFLEQLYTFDAIDRDPRSRTISISYFALINQDLYEISKENKSHDAQWYSIKNLPALAFDHNQIIKTALTRLQNKISYHPLGFELLAEEFTLSELQQLYQTVLDLELDKRNFRKKLIATGIISSTGKIRTGMRNRPSELFRFNEKEYKRLLKQGFNFKLV